MEGLEPMVRMYLNQVPVIKIAEHFGVSRETVYSRLRTIPNYKEVSLSLRNAKRENKIKKHSQRLPEINKLAEQGVGMVGISKKLNIPYYTVKALLRGTKYDSTHKAKEFRDRNIYSLYRRGMTQTQLAKKYNLAQSSISDRIKKWETSHKTSKQVKRQKTSS